MEEMSSEEREDGKRKRRKRKTGGACEGEKGHRRLDRPGRARRQAGGMAPATMAGAPQGSPVPGQGAAAPNPQQQQQMMQQLAMRRQMQQRAMAQQALAAQGSGGGAPQQSMPAGAKRGGRNWIQATGVDKPGHKGALHRALGVPEEEKIPEKKLEKASASSSSHMRHMAQFAKNVKGSG